MILPIVAPGIAATALLCCIFAWNEFFFAVNLSDPGQHGADVPGRVHHRPQGAFFAKLSAASTLAVPAVVIAGWIAQKR